MEMYSFRPFVWYEEEEETSPAPPEREERLHWLPNNMDVLIGLMDDSRTASGWFVDRWLRNISGQHTMR